MEQSPRWAVVLNGMPSPLQVGVLYWGLAENQKTL
jgi:hypothetical protein